LIARRNFVGGLVEGFNYPRGKYNKDKPFIDLNDCTDIIVVDRNYFKENVAFILAWASDETQE